MRLWKHILLCIVAGIVSLSASAQADRREVRQGNKQFRKEEWRQADISYRKALVKDSTSFAGNYNLANNLYRQDGMDEAKKFMDKALEQAPVQPRGADAYFNAGDIAIAQKDWQTAVDVLKKAMLMDPSDLEAKENYAYAKKMLENQQNGGGGGGDNDQNQDQNQNQDQDQDNNQDNNQDQNNDQNQDQDNKDDQNNDQNQNQDQDQNKDQDDRQQQGGISPQQAQQMLNAIQAKEKETQEKVNKEKAELLKSKQKEKNW